MTDFWCILFGIVSTAIVLGGIYGLIELADRRDHARYRRRQQDRVNRGVGYIHNGQVSTPKER